MKLNLNLPEETQPAQTKTPNFTEINEPLENIQEKKSSSKNKNYGLDEFQKSAVKNTEQQILIVAGPGSGKTTVLTQHIGYLISECGIKPENFLAITFTKKSC